QRAEGARGHWPDQLPNGREPWGCGRGPKEIGKKTPAARTRDSGVLSEGCNRCGVRTAAVLKTRAEIDASRLQAEPGVGIIADSRSGQTRLTFVWRFCNPFSSNCLR